MPEPLDSLLQNISQIEQKIAEGELSRALEFARSSAGLPDPDQVLLQLLSSWNTAERNVLENLLSEDDYKVERAKITKRLLLFLEELKAKLKAEGPLLSGEDSLPSPPDYDGKPQILILYAPADELHWTDLSKHLFMLLRDKAIQFVDAQKDIPLAVVNRLAYQQKLVDQARVVLVIVSPNAMTPEVFELANQALTKAKLIPIRVETVNTEGTPFNEDIKGLPHHGGVVSAWPNRNSAWLSIAQALQALTNQIKEESKQ